MSKPITTGVVPNAVDRPSHYQTHPSGIEAIEVVRYMGFNLGNALKYLWRLGEKDGPYKNAKKALWYLVDEQNAMHPLRRMPNPEGCLLQNPLMQRVLATEPDKSVKEAMRYVYLAHITRDGYFYDQARIYLARIIAFHALDIDKPIAA